MASALAFMDRMGLIPVVVHGAGLFSGRRAAEVAEALRHDAQFDRQSKGLVGQERDKEAAGRRLRRKAARQAMRAARRYMSRANRALCRSLAALGVETAPMLMDAFEATVDCEVEGAGEGVVGTITRVRTDDILAAVEEGLVPVIAALAPLEEEEEEEEEDEEHESGPEEVEEEEEEEEEDNDDASLDGQALTFSTWDAAAALAKELQPLKVVILRPEGGFLRTSEPACRAGGRDSPQPRPGPASRPADPIPPWPRCAPGADAGNTSASRALPTPRRRLPSRSHQPREGLRGALPGGRYRP